MFNCSKLSCITIQNCYSSDFVVKLTEKGTRNFVNLRVKIKWFVGEPVGVQISLSFWTENCNCKD